MENKSKFMLIHCSSGHKHALQEVLQDPVVQNQLADTKYAQEMTTLDKFFKMLNEDPDRAFYGWNHVNKAEERAAVGTLMLSDELFRYENSSVVNCINIIRQKLTKHLLTQIS